MSTVIVILILIVSVLLALVVLVQNSKGGGLVSNFGSANQMMGVRQTTNFLEKATWTMAIILVVLCLLSSMTIDRSGTKKDQDSELVKNLTKDAGTTSNPENTNNAGTTENAGDLINETK